MTPEERAERLCNELNLCFDQPDEVEQEIRHGIAAAIRDAVAAERERCAQTALALYAGEPTNAPAHTALVRYRQAARKIAAVIRMGELT